MINGKFIHAILIGEAYEGYSVRGIFSSEEAAIAAAHQLAEAENADGSSYKRLAAADARWESSGGSCYIEVIRWPADQLF